MRTFTADYHQRHAASCGHAAMVLLADVHAPAREYAVEHPSIAESWGQGEWFTIGYLTGMVGDLLDALGYPEQGPNVDQRSWLAGGAAR